MPHCPIAPFAPRPLPAAHLHTLPWSRSAARDCSSGMAQPAELTPAPLGEGALTWGPGGGAGRQGAPRRTQRRRGRRTEAAPGATARLSRAAARPRHVTTFSVTPRHPLPPPHNHTDEAGSVWRGEKLRGFAFRARCLGVEGDPAAAALLRQIAEHTAALEALAEAQRAPGASRPWWADGEYDAARADRWGRPGSAANCRRAPNCRPTTNPASAPPAPVGAAPMTRGRRRLRRGAGVTPSTPLARPSGSSPRRRCTMPTARRRPCASGSPPSRPKTPTTLRSGTPATCGPICAAAAPAWRWASPTRQRRASVQRWRSTAPVPPPHAAWPRRQRWRRSRSSSRQQRRPQRSRAGGQR